MMFGSTDESNSDDARHARIAKIRRQIAEGTYETPDKLEAAVDALLLKLNADRPAASTEGFDPR